MKPRTPSKKSGKRPELLTDAGVSEATAGTASATSSRVPREMTKANAQEATPADEPTSRVGRRGREHAERDKVVRDTFTMPRSDYAKIAALTQRCLDAGVQVKKSELVRAGLLLLESEPTTRLLAAVSAVETVKTGRPPES
ncbi:hypothetical protein [Paraburkholderia sacchari]|uniref:hypothetical protein n=1 Tax=Paraburkholderia sacchari TaxID=159450 RepID=UPI001BCAB4AE|nr:hypothetical protein [Paraburkholderia sacchari]